MTVPIHTLQRLLEDAGVDRVDVLKLVVEGSELVALRGARRILLDQRPLVWVSIHPAGVFPRFPEANPRSVCNRRRVPGVQATYVSQRGYIGPDFVVLEALFPAGRGVRVTLPIRVM